jgi:capsular exopolysaccharide synthesis family protein
LLGDAKLADCIQLVPSIENLSVLASGPLPPNPAELLTSPKAGQLIRGLLQYYDYVIVDTPPILPVTDALVISGVVDMTLLIASQKRSKRRQAHRAVDQLRQVDAPVVGTVFNSVPGGLGYGAYAYYSGGGPTYREKRRDTKEKKRSKSEASETSTR